MAHTVYRLHAGGSVRGESGESLQLVGAAALQCRKRTARIKQKKRREKPRHNRLRCDAPASQKPRCVWRGLRRGCRELGSRVGRPRHPPRRRRNGGGGASAAERTHADSAHGSRCAKRNSPTPKMRLPRRPRQLSRVTCDGAPPRRQRQSSAARTSARVAGALSSPSRRRRRLPAPRGCPPTNLCWPAVGQERCAGRPGAAGHLAPPDLGARAAAATAERGSHQALKRGVSKSRAEQRWRWRGEATCEAQPPSPPLQAVWVGASRSGKRALCRGLSNATAR